LDGVSTLALALSSAAGAAVAKPHPIIIATAKSNARGTLSRVPDRLSRGWMGACMRFSEKYGCLEA
jgi:hypothetical protein